jgi:single-strand DNA-binding protein
MNVWTFVGRIGKDAETRYTPKGDAVCSFSVAVDSGYGENKTTTWARVALFGKRAEALAQYLTKGQQVAVSGEVTLRQYKTKDGTEGSSLEVRAQDITLVGGKQEAKQEAPKPKKDAPSFSDMDSDIPFANPYRGNLAYVV